MEALNWATQHWLDLLQSVGIVCGLCFSSYTIRREGKARRITNFISIAQNHRSIWGELYDRTALGRVWANNVDLEQNPISNEEHLFVTLLILHLDTVRRATEEGMFVPLEGLSMDIREFLGLPIPSAVWAKVKRFQDADFVRFVEQCLG